MCKVVGNVNFILEFFICECIYVKYRVFKEFHFKVVKKIQMKRSESLINAKNLFVSALTNTAHGKFDVSVLRLYLNKYDKLLESEHKKIDKELILNDKALKLNLINKIYVSNSNYKIMYERAS